jgi:general stress protein YciG
MTTDREVEGRGFCEAHGDFDGEDCPDCLEYATIAAKAHADAARPRKPQGFAAISPERQREIASKGGKAAQALGRAHRFTAETAREAGRKGGRGRKKA